MAMKVLVTGGAGYVGSVLAHRLLAEGRSVVVLDNLMYDNGDVLIPLFSSPSFEFVKGDVRDQKLLADLVGKVDAVVHLAAIVGFPACEKNKDLATVVNTDATRNIASLVSKDQILVFASTGSNYGAVDGVCTEETPLNPLSHYGKTKTEAERLAQQEGAVVYRFATAFGASPRMRLDLLINDFVYQAITNRYLVMFEKHFKRTFIHVRDMARVLSWGLDHGEMRGNIYNAGDASNNYSKEDIALMIRAKADFYLHFADIGKDMDQRNYEVSYDKLNATGFRCETSVEDGINELISIAPALQPRSRYRNA